MRVGDGNVDERQFHIEMDGLPLLKDPARGVMLNVVWDSGLGNRKFREIPDDDANEQKKNEWNAADTCREQTTLHKVPIVPIVLALNLRDWCRFLGRCGQSLDEGCSLQIVRSSYRHR
jgi:hypothetical protein